MKTLLKISLVLLLAIGTTSCFMDGTNGNGNVIKDNRKISNDFIKIKASGGLDVYLTNAHELGLTIEADENLHELIKTEVSEGTLYISTTKNIRHAKAKKVWLSIDHINEIIATSGVNLVSKDIIKTDKIKLVASSGADVDLQLEANEVDCSTSSGADINLKGNAQHFKGNSSSGSDIDAYNFTVEDCELNANSGADIKIHVTKTIYSKSSSGGDIHVKGNPEVLTEKKNKISKDNISMFKH